MVNLWHQAILRLHRRPMLLTNILVLLHLQETITHPFSPPRNLSRRTETRERTMVASLQDDGVVGLRRSKMTPTDYLHHEAL